MAVALNIIDRRPPGQSHQIDAIVFSRAAVDSEGRARRFVVNDNWKDATRRAALAGGAGGWQSAPTRLALLLTARRGAIAQANDGPDRGESEILRTEVNQITTGLIDMIDLDTVGDLDAQASRVDLALVRGAPLPDAHRVIWDRYRPILERTKDWVHVIRLAGSADELHVLAQELPLAVAGDDLSAASREQATDAIRATIADAAKAFMTPAQLRATEERATIAQRRAWWASNVAAARYEVNGGNEATVLIGWDRSVIRVP